MEARFIPKLVFCIWFPFLYILGRLDAVYVSASTIVWFSKIQVEEWKDSPCNRTFSYGLWFHTCKKSSCNYFAHIQVFSCANEEVRTWLCAWKWEMHILYRSNACVCKCKTRGSSWSSLLLHKQCMYFQIRPKKNLFGSFSINWLK